MSANETRRLYQIAVACEATENGDFVEGGTVMGFHQARAGTYNPEFVHWLSGYYYAFEGEGWGDMFECLMAYDGL